MYLLKRHTGVQYKVARPDSNYGHYWAAQEDSTKYRVTPLLVGKSNIKLFSNHIDIHYTNLVVLQD